MEYIIFFFLFLISISLSFLIYLVYSVKSVYIDEIDKEKLKGISPPSPQIKISSFEEERAKRENQLDERARQLKEDIEKEKENLVQNHGYPAEELHPDVKNIPYEENKTRQNPFDVEVAE